MKAIIASVFTLFLAVASASAQTSSAETQTPPSEVSVRQLLQVMQTQKLVDGLSQRMDAMFTAMVKKMIEGKTITPEQQQRLDAARGRVDDMAKEVLNWQTMEPIYIKVYTESFSQSEIDAMTSFYSSPTGQAIVAKLPVAMEKSSSLMQQQMLTVLLPKMQQMAKEAAAQIKSQPDAGSKSSS